MPWETFLGGAWWFSVCIFLQQVYIIYIYIHPTMIVVILDFFLSWLQRKKQVLTHSLGHVSQNDLITHALAGLGPWNPPKTGWKPAKDTLGKRNFTSTQTTYFWGSNFRFQGWHVKCLFSWDLDNFCSWSPVFQELRIFGWFCCDPFFQAIWSHDSSAETFGNKRCVFFVACNFSGKLRGLKWRIWTSKNNILKPCPQIHGWNPRY